MLPELIKLKEVTTNLISEDDRLYGLIKNWDVALDAIDDPVMVVDAECNIKCVNKAMLNTFGESDKKNLIGKKCHRYPYKISDSCSLCFTQDKFFYDGAINKWFDHSSNIIYDNSNNDIGRICVLKDVTEYKDIEEKLKHKLLSLTYPSFDLQEISIQDVVDVGILQQLQDMFSSVCNVACVVMDPKGNPVTQPSNFSRFCELLRSTDLGIKRCGNSKAEYCEKVRKTNKIVVYSCNIFNELLEAAIPLHVNNKNVGVVCMGQNKIKPIPEDKVRKYAEEIGIDADELVDASNKLHCTSREAFEKSVSFFRSVCSYVSLLGTQNVQQAKELSKRLEAEKELLESKYRFKDVTSVLSDWVWETNRDNIYTYCSGRVEDALGYSYEEVVGKSMFDFMPMDTVDNVYKFFNEKAMKREIIVEFRNWHVTKNDKLVCVSTNCVPRFDEDGRYTGYRGADTLIPEIYAEDRCGKL